MTTVQKQKQKQGEQKWFHYLNKLQASMMLTWIGVSSSKGENVAKLQA